MIVKKEEAVIKKALKAIQVTGKKKGVLKKILNKKQSAELHKHSTFRDNYLLKEDS